MCLAIPVRVAELLDNGNAVVELGGVRKEISLALVDGVSSRRLRHRPRRLCSEPARSGRGGQTLALFAEITEGIAPTSPSLK